MTLPAIARAQGSTSTTTILGTITKTLENSWVDLSQEAGRPNPTSVNFFLRRGVEMFITKLDPDIS